jgi:hypothetical protein
MEKRKDHFIYHATELIEYYSDIKSLVESLETRTQEQQVIDDQTKVIDDLVVKGEEMTLEEFIKRVKSGSFDQYSGMSWS